MPKNNLPKPPASLSKESAAYFTKFCEEYETDGLKANGSLTTLDRFGCIKCHPLVLVERAASAAAINGIKALGVLKNDTMNRPGIAGGRLV